MKTIRFLHKMTSLSGKLYYIFELAASAYENYILLSDVRWFLCSVEALEIIFDIINERCKMIFMVSTSSGNHFSSFL